MSRAAAINPAAHARKLAVRPGVVTPCTRVRAVYARASEAGEAFAFACVNPTGATVSEDLAPATRSDEAKRGITIGILVVALICLSLFFVWRHYGVVGADARAGASTTR